MSTTEYMSVTSFTSTYGAMLPEAIVDTMTFGTPTGSVRIAAVTIVVPPPPPRPSTPSNRPSAYQAGRRAHAPRCIASTACPRSPRARSVARSVPAARATSSAPTSVSISGLSEHAEVHEQRAVAARVNQVAHVAVLVALGVERAEEKDGASRHERRVLHGSSIETSTRAGPSKSAGDRMARITSVSSPAL